MENNRLIGIFDKLKKLLSGIFKLSICLCCAFLYQSKYVLVRLYFFKKAILFSKLKAIIFVFLLTMFLLGIIFLFIFLWKLARAAFFDDDENLRY